MNSRITPFMLEEGPYKELVCQLAFLWLKAGLPSGELLYGDYLHAIALLLLTTQNPDQTRAITTAVLNQALDLGRSSAWVQQELKVEGILSCGDRADFLRFELSQLRSVDDATLDTYNERMNRFAPHPVTCSP